MGTFDHFSKHDIVAVTVSLNERQVFVGNVNGVVSVFNYTTGAMTQTFQIFSMVYLVGVAVFTAATCVAAYLMIERRNRLFRRHTRG